MGSIGGDEAMQGPMGHEERIYVSVRIRPLNEREIYRNDVSDWECINENTIICRNNLSASDRSLYPTAYTFDRVFRADCSTRQVYEDAAREVAMSVVSGINSSIFAYGQTSSGKTYTMSGITEFTVEDIYNYIEKHKEREFFLKFSAIEIYNESVRDLLSSDSTPRRLLDDPERGTVVEKLTEETLRDWDHFKELISFCDAQRQIGETSLNEASSRSHQIIRLTIESSAREFLGNDKSSSLAASVNFVDLAGSERASQTNSAGARLKEGCHINRSLLTLGTVIRKLSKGRNGHVPFRDSKLTRILQSSLGGNARTAIICTMSPARSHVEQTRNTLLFASCAKEVATNARVNVVMSDKALVKQLQRELARLESVLRNSGSAFVASDSSTLLREKDLQIEKLTKEVTELTLQRDHARSRIKDMLQMGGDDLSSVDFESLDPQYPKLRVRSSWDPENPTSETPHFPNLHCKESVRSFDASQYSDVQSISSEENLFQLPDFEKNLPCRNPSAKLLIRDHDVGDLYQEHTEEQNENISEDLSREVRVIESEDVNTDRFTSSKMTDPSPNHTGSGWSSPWASTDASGLTVIDNGDKESQDLGSSGGKKNKRVSSFTRCYVIPFPEKTSALLSENSTSTTPGLKLPRSSSCKASLMMNASSYWFEKEESIENTPPIGTEKDFAGRPEGFQRKKVHALSYDIKSEKWDGQQIAVGSDTNDELNVQNVRASIAMESDSNGSQASERNEKADVESANQMAEAEHEVPETGLMPIPETGLMPIVSAKNVKDVGLDPMQFDGEIPEDWSSEFKRLQMEIIELWHSCNVSLVHRTYFFLLFKGDSSDSIYMEVERRRLFFLKKTFSRGNKTLEDGQALTPATSLSNLKRERKMLCKQLHKRLSKGERENLYLKWGIRLSSWHRGAQLANLLWTKTQDMNHISESASLVAKLVGSVEPEQAFKEMFGLYFTPRRTSYRRSWSVSNILQV